VEQIQRQYATDLNEMYSNKNHHNLRLNEKHSNEADPRILLADQSGYNLNEKYPNVADPRTVQVHLNGYNPSGYLSGLSPNEIDRRTVLVHQSDCNRSGLNPSGSSQNEKDRSDFHQRDSNPSVLNLRGPNLYV